MKWILLLLIFTISACVPTAKDNKLAVTADTVQPTITLSTTGTVSENVAGGTYSIVASLNKVWHKDVTVPITYYGTATASGTDYTASVASITIPAGSLYGIATVTIVNDALYENNETIVAILGNPTNARLGSNYSQTITIVDDEHTALLPTVSVNAGSIAIAIGEAGGVASVQVDLSAIATYDVFVPVTISTSSTATKNADYTYNTTYIQIAAGAVSATSNVTITNDSLYEGATAETIIINLGTPQGATLGASTTSTISITENDAAPSIQYAAAAGSIGEATSTGYLTLSLSAASSVPLSFTLSRTGGTATQGGVDFLFASPQTLTFPANSTSMTVPYTIMNDNVYEGTETVAFDVLAVAPLALGVQTTYTLSITDNESLPYVRFSSTGIIISETAGTITIPVVSSVPTQSALAVSIGVAGTATNGTDYAMVTSPVTIPANSTTGSITLSLTNDALGETTENAIFSISPLPASYNSGVGDNTYTVTLIDDDPIPVVNFTASSQSVAEAVANIPVGLTLSSASASTVTGTITITGTATNGGTDYDNAVVAYSFTPGTTAAPAVAVSFDVAADALDENNETVIFTLGTPVNATLGTTTVHTATITDDDATPTVSVDNVGADIDLTEGVPETVTVRATLSAASGLDVTVPYTVSGTATDGTDYIKAGSLNVSAGSTTADLTFDTTVGTNDTIDEGAVLAEYETIIVTIDPPTNASLIASPSTITITDDDAAPTFDFVLATDSVTEQSTSKTVAITMSNGSYQEITVPIDLTFSTASVTSDYIASPSSLVIPACTAEPCTTTYNINVEIVDNTTKEDPEDVVLTIVNAQIDPLGAATAGLTPSHTLTINDEDLLINFSSTTATIAESASTTYTIENLASDGVTPENVPVGGDISIPYTITGTATNGTDYTTLTGTATILAGANNTTITVDSTAFNDDYNEGDETVILTIGTPTYTGVTYEAYKGVSYIATTTISSSDPVTFISLGSTHSCVVIDTNPSTDMIKCWGDNSTLQAGNATSTNNIGDAASEMGTSLAAITGPAGTPSQVVSGRYHSCGLWGTSVYCWGNDFYGQLGDGATINNTATPTLATGMTNIERISAGDFHTCAVVTGGATMYCWGENADGQIGDGTTTQRPSPTAVNVAALTGDVIIALSSGNNHNCLIADSATDRLFCWGDNDYGQLGLDSTTDTTTATEVTGLAGGFVPTQLSLGGDHSCAFDGTDDARCWGKNNYGQLGQGNILNYGSDALTQSIALLPDISVTGGENLAAIYAGGDSTCVINSANEVKCFGYNQQGQLGNDSTTTIGTAAAEMTALTAVSLGTGLTATSMDLGENHTCAVLNNGRIKCWGLNTSGQLGIESTSTIGDQSGEMSSVSLPNL